MKEFIEKNRERIHGLLCCFDRMLFRGYLPIVSGRQMAQFFNSSGIRFREPKTFLVQKGRAREASCHDHRRTRRTPICVSA